MRTSLQLTLDGCERTEWPLWLLTLSGANRKHMLAYPLLLAEENLREVVSLTLRADSVTGTESGSGSNLSV